METNILMKFVDYVMEETMNLRYYNENLPDLRLIFCYVIFTNNCLEITDQNQINDFQSQKLLNAYD